MLVNRVTLSNRLCMSIRSTYRVFPATESSLIDAEEVIALLNRSRSSSQPPIRGEVIPQLYDSTRAAEFFGINERRVRSWALRSRHPCPHFRVSYDGGKTTKLLFQLSVLDEWQSKKRAI